MNKKILMSAALMTAATVSAQTVPQLVPQAQEKKEVAPIRLMVFGDSLSVGHNLSSEEAFYSQLEQVLQKEGYRVNVINHSQSGITTGGALKRLTSAFKKKPDGVILQLGSNDTFQSVPLEETTNNLQELISAFKNKSIPVFLVGMEVPLQYQEEYRTGVRKMYENLALENELLLYPFFMNGLWKEDGTHLSSDYFLEDKIHPTAKGVSIMVTHILPAVKQFLQEDVAAGESEMTEENAPEEESAPKEEK